MEARDLVAALIKHGLTQVQIAEKAGMTQPSVSKVLRGDVADVMSRNYLRLEALYEEVIGERPERAPLGLPEAKAA